jgi:serine/threonine protein kinase
MMRQTLFPGNHNLKQLDKIIEVMGYPTDEDIDFITNEHTLNYLRKLPRTKVAITKWEERIPHANPQAIDLLLKMLRFSPDHRITIKEAINHPYFQSF